MMQLMSSVGCYSRKASGSLSTGMVAALLGFHAASFTRSGYRTRSRRNQVFGSLRVLSDNGALYGGLSSVATPRYAEESGSESEKEVLEHAAKKIEMVSDDDHQDETIQVKGDNGDDSLLLSNCGLSNEILRALEKRGIRSLFPIQKHVFDPAMAGRDLIGRAKTGSGKTLAFAIPVVENLLKENKETGRLTVGRPPRAIVITPTRELANQVSREFQSVCPSLSVRSFYGGVSVVGNATELRKGVDVAVGTPGRLMDLVNRRHLDLSKIRFAILDESDQMLDMGFEEDMEKILAYTPKEKQTMLFSATLPGWVRKIARKYLQNQIIVDLLGDEGSGKIADTITALGIFVQRENKRSILGDLLSTYAPGKQSIVFTQTKREADVVHTVAMKMVSSAPLHGDISQNSRERTLEDFRKGKFKCLVATDVAARGLDIPSVDLVLHYDCPQSHESFVHRSGRTGRAGKTGTTLVMVTPGDVHSFHRIVVSSKTRLEMVGPSNPRDMMQASTKHVLDKIQGVTPEVIQFFQPAAKKLINAGNGEHALAAAFAAMTGFVKIPKAKSLLTGKEGWVTLRFLGRPGKIAGFGSVATIVSELVGNQTNSGDIGTYEPVTDNETQLTGALVDLSTTMATQVLQKASAKHAKLTGVRIDRHKALSLEQLVAKHPDRGGNSKRSRPGRSNFGGGNFGNFGGAARRDGGGFRSGGGFRNSRDWNDRSRSNDRRDRFDDGFSLSPDRRNRFGDSGRRGRGRGRGDNFRSSRSRSFDDVW